MLFLYSKEDVMKGLLRIRIFDHHDQHTVSLRHSHSSTRRHQGTQLVHNSAG